MFYDNLNEIINDINHFNIVDEVHYMVYIICENSMKTRCSTMKAENFDKSFFRFVGFAHVCCRLKTDL